MDTTTYAQPYVLQVDFTWGKFKALITEDGRSDPLYIVDYHLLPPPHLVFKSAANDTTIGTGTLHTFSICPDYELHGIKDKLKAQKRFKTLYTHRSRAYSENGSPVTMTWTSSSGFETWDFVCVDEKQIAVAKFSANLWSLKNIGKIEFLGPKATDPAAHDEIVVIGITLFYCMFVRLNNVFNVVGSLVLRPNHDNKKNSATNREHAD